MRVLAAVGLCVAMAGIARADQLSPDDLAKKNEDGYFTGLPLAAYSADFGFGFGARAYYYFDGKRTDPRFAETPYLYRVFLQAFVSTGGIQFHWLDFDAPRIGNSPYRLRGQAILMRNTAQNYFGLGDRSLGRLSFPGSPKAYDSFTEYHDDQEHIVGGETFGRYDQYDILRPIFVGSVERMFDHDRVRALAGIGLSYTRIEDYTGKTVDAVGANGQATTAPEAQTRLAADCAAGLVVGCHGGRDNYLRVGLSYDTRDFEPDPNSGVFADAELDLATVAVGSQFDYVRFVAALRDYWTPVKEHDVVLAGRAAFLYQSKDAPFFSMDTFPFTEDPRTGLGGHRTLRGFKQDRFVGSVMTLANAEVRWTFAHATIKRQKFAFIAVPFVDAGRPFDKLSELSVRRWQASYGGALRISWNLATIVTIDYGVSDEDSGLYVNFNHIF